MRSALPEDQNLIFYQPQTEIQQNNLKLRNSGIRLQNQEVFATPQNVVLIKNVPEETQEDNQVRPVRYHGIDLKKSQQSVVPNYHQQLFLGRLLPSTNSERQSTQQQFVYHQILAPINVVPPQENHFQQVPVQPHYTIQQQEIPQEIQHTPLQYVHIPINKEVQIPQHIKTVVPLIVNSKTQISQSETQSQPQQTEDSTLLKETIPNVQSRFASQDIQTPEKQDKNTNAEIAALEFARYIASKQEEAYSDSVVIDAKAEESDKEEDSEGKIFKFAKYA